ncbi:MAG: MOSC domain-containing protein [Candidatus Omnitrophica bacterium]|nr:MOSC domain-containing protein [Candidatus Omnitrophota bacterium]
MAKIVSINISEQKGIAKKPVKEGVLREDHGLVGDIHSGPGDRQVSLLAIESIQKQIGKAIPAPGGQGVNKCPKTRAKGVNLKPGDFAENITTEGVDLAGLDIGTELIINDNVVLKITKIGKECHRFCSIYYKTGDCIMPREGIFAQVVNGGGIKIGDKIKVVRR